MGKWSDQCTLHTFMLYQTDCFTLTHLKVASFTISNFTQNMALSVDELYPEKMRNFNWCPVYVAPSNTRPYVIHLNNSSGNKRYEGIDISIIEQIAKILKMTIVYNSTESPSSKSKLELVGTFFITKKKQTNFIVLKIFEPSFSSSFRRHRKVW